MDSDFEKAKKLVEAAIRALGLDPAALQAESAQDRVGWCLKRGSAAVLVTVTHRADKTTYVRVASPVVTLPADPAKQTSLFRKVLELNAAGLANAAFGLAGERIVAVSERPTAGLDSQEVEQMVRHLSAVADTFDDRLVREFGATKA